MQPSVIVVGGGNAAMCAALSAADAGAKVTVFERAPAHRRGGNTRHTRNVRTAHQDSDAYVTGQYSPAEFLSDLTAVGGSSANRGMAALTVERSLTLVDWMEKHGARWQPPLRGTLSLSRTNHFFLGGGKAHLNTYYLTAAASGIAVEYEAEVMALDFEGRRCVGVCVRRPDGEHSWVSADAVIVAAGGFEANRDWLRVGWGAAADTLVVRGTPFNDGRVLRLLMDAGARTIGDPKAAHAIAVDARAPMYDAGIITRLDVIPLGIVVNSHGRRFSDEGEDIWPKRYASWGRLIADQPGSVAFAVYDSGEQAETIPGLYPPTRTESIGELGEALGINSEDLESTVHEYNAACPSPSGSRIDELDGCATMGLPIPKSNWARPISKPPFYAYPLKPGITFTYFGLEVDEHARVAAGSGLFENVYAAGEIMAGNVLSEGYLAGIGMTIGSVWGRIAGEEAARA